MYSKSQKIYNEIYLLIKYVKSLLWRVAERLSYIEDSWRLNVKSYILLNIFLSYARSIYSVTCVGAQVTLS